MKSPLLIAMLLTCAFACAQTNNAAEQRIVLPNISLVNCTSSDCFQLLQDGPAHPGDIYPTHIDVAFLNYGCPFGIDAIYDKNVPLDFLEQALEKRYGQGVPKHWTHAPVILWELNSSNVFIDLDVADKKMAKNRHIPEGTRTIHFISDSAKSCGR